MANRISHDQNFKNLILDYPRDALSFFAPNEAPLPDDQVEFTPLRQEQLQQHLGAHYRELDVPLQVEWTDGRRETILFALEEETDPRHFSIHRLIHYCVDLSKLNKTNRVIPVVIFLGEAGSAPASLALGSKDHNHLTFDYLSCKLKDIPYERWQHSDNLVARLNLPNMRYPADHKKEVFDQAYHGLLALEPDRVKQAKYLRYIDIYAGLTDNELQQWQQEYLEDKPNMAGYAEYLIQEGKQVGLQEGRQEGRQEGERLVLERLLQRRFGVLTPEITEKLSEASSTELENWAENVLDAEKLEDVFGSSH